MEANQRHPLQKVQLILEDRAGVVDDDNFVQEVGRSACEDARDGSEQRRGGLVVERDYHRCGGALRRRRKLEVAGMAAGRGRWGYVYYLANLFEHFFNFLNGSYVFLLSFFEIFVFFINLWSFLCRMQGWRVRIYVGWLGSRAANGCQ